MVKGLDSKSNGVTRAGSNPAAVVLFAILTQELTLSYEQNAYVKFVLPNNKLIKK